MASSEHKPHSRADAILTDLIAFNAGGWEAWARILAGRVADLEEQYAALERERDELRVELDRVARTLMRTAGATGV